MCASLHLVSRGRPSLDDSANECLGAPSAKVFCRGPGNAFERAQLDWGANLRTARTVDLAWFLFRAWGLI